MHAGVQGLGFRDWDACRGSGFRVQGLGVHAGFRVQGPGFRDWAACRVQGSGFRDWGCVQGARMRDKSPGEGGRLSTGRKLERVCKSQVPGFSAQGPGFRARGFR